MVRVLGEFPGVHATFNFVPLLAAQIEEYASGNSRSRGSRSPSRLRNPLRPEQKRELLERAFQVNENFCSAGRVTRSSTRKALSGGAEACARAFQPGRLARLAGAFAACLDGRGISGQGSRRERRCLRRAADSPSDDKSALREKQHELLNAVLPEYRHRCRSRPDRNFHHTLLPSDSAAACATRISPA